MIKLTKMGVKKAKNTANKCYIYVLEELCLIEKAEEPGFDCVVGEVCLVTICQHWSSLVIIGQR